MSEPQETASKDVEDAQRRKGGKKAEVFRRFFHIRQLDTDFISIVTPENSRAATNSSGTHPEVEALVYIQDFSPPLEEKPGLPPLSFPLCGSESLKISRFNPESACPTNLNFIVRREAVGEFSAGRTWDLFRKTHLSPRREWPWNIMGCLSSTRQAVSPGTLLSLSWMKNF